MGLEESMRPGESITIIPDSREVHAMARELVRVSLPGRTGERNDEYATAVAALAVAITLAVTDKWVSETIKRGALHEIPRK